jgi:hypothetical protein
MLSFAGTGHLQFIAGLPFRLPFDNGFMVTVQRWWVSVKRDRQQGFPAS